jgi:hypothetical protein
MSPLIEPFLDDAVAAHQAAPCASRSDARRVATARARSAGYGALRDPDQRHVRALIDLLAEAVGA